MEGGDIEGAVVNLPVSGDYIQKKQLGNLKYNDFKVACGLSMGKPLQDWIDASLAMNYMRKSGQIDAADFKKDTKYSREFYDALITEITMPACDGSAKDAAYLNLTFSPEKTRNKAGSGKVKVDDANVKQKIWYPANFRVTIPGLDTGLVAKVDALTVKQKNVRDDIGIVRDSQLEPAAVEYPNASFTVSEEGSDTWWKYHEDFVITGNSQETKTTSRASSTTCRRTSARTRPLAQPPHDGYLQGHCRRLGEQQGSHPSREVRLLHGAAHRREVGVVTNP